MPIGRYRLTVVGCALSWLLVGMHLPMLRHMMDDRHSHDWLVLTMTALLAVVGIAGVWKLLRSADLRSDRSGTSGTAA